MNISSKVIPLVLISIFAIVGFAYAHQSGCHRWHSCPSDTGSYVCGDLGYPCLYGTTSTSSSTSTPKPTVKPTVTKKVTPTPKPVVKTIASKDVPAVVDKVFRSVYNRKPTSAEANYWKNRARTDKKTESVLKAAMQDQKTKGIKH